MNHPQPPGGGEVDRHIERRMLLAYSKVGAPITVVYVVLAMMFFRNGSLDQVAGAGMGVSFALAYLLAKEWIPRWTRAAIPLVLVILFAGLSRLDGGVASVVYTVLPAFVLMMRFLVGARLAAAFAASLIVWAGLMVVHPPLVVPSQVPELPRFLGFSRVVIVGLANLFALWFTGIPAGMLHRALVESRTLAVELEERVERRTRSLEEAKSALRISNEELQRTNRDLESFARSLTHDLKAPVRSIAGYAAVLAEEHERTLPESSLRHLVRIQDATRRMDDLIEAILNLSRSSVAPIHPQRLDLAAMAREIHHACARSNRGRAVLLESPERAWAWGDPVLLRTVVENLLTNAWKFTGRSTEARIDFETESVDVGTVFVVRDNGAGFDRTYAGKLFQHFSRLHGMEEFEGSGIGLANARRIVERHGGWIDADGEPGRGATFRFWLPAEPAEA